VTSNDKQLIQQLVITLVLTTIQITISLSIHIPKGFDHQSPNGGQPGNSPRGDLLGKPPFNPLVGPFGWPTPDPHMFIPPWHQPPIVQLVSKPITKLLYMKLQYPTYVKNIDPNAHIKMFKKAVKSNGENSRN